MCIRDRKINSVAPDFTAQTQMGEIKFHEWLGDSWGVLFSHPKDFTPVCTTELGALARMKPEFDARNVKVMGLSVDPVSDHEKWLEDLWRMLLHLGLTRLLSVKRLLILHRVPKSMIQETILICNRLPEV